MNIDAHWLVRPDGLPIVHRRCLRCPSSRFRTHGKFRVNANHKLLDVWLLALCTGCGETVKLTVLERVHVRAVDPATLTRFHGNDPALAALLLQDARLPHRNGVTLDWDGAWTLRRTPAAPEAAVTATSVRFAGRVPIRVTTLLAAGLEVSRAEVRRLVAAGSLRSPHRLTGTASSDFTFTLAVSDRRRSGEPVSGQRGYATS